MHPLVRDWIRLRCNSTEFVALSVIALQILGTFFRASWETQNYIHKVSAPQRQQLLAHLMAIPENVQMWRHTFSEYRQVKGRCSDSMQNATSAASYQIASCMEYCNYTCDISITRSLMCALPTLFSPWRIRELDLKADWEAGFTLLTLCNAHVVLGDYSDAFEMAQTTLEVCERDLGKSHVSYSNSSSDCSAFFTCPVY